MSELTHAELGGFIADRVEVGVFAVDAAFTITLWNRFMATHSRRPAAEVIGRNLFAPSPGANLMVSFPPDFKIHDDLDSGLQHCDLAKQFVAVPKGDNVFGRGLDNGKEIICFFKIVLKINTH